MQVITVLNKYSFRCTHCISFVIIISLYFNRCKKQLISIIYRQLAVLLSLPIYISICHWKTHINHWCVCIYMYVYIHMSHMYKNNILFYMLMFCDSWICCVQVYSCHRCLFRTPLNFPNQTQVCFGLCVASDPHHLPSRKVLVFYWLARWPCCAIALSLQD